MQTKILYWWCGERDFLYIRSATIRASKVLLGASTIALVSWQALILIVICDCVHQKSLFADKALFSEKYCIFNKKFYTSLTHSF